MASGAAGAAGDGARLAGRRVALHVGAGIAAVKVPALVTMLRSAGAEVRVAMTARAVRFVTPLSLEALSGNPVLTSLWRGARSPRGDPLPHVELAEWCDVQVVVAASADLIARLAHGLADDAVTTTVLSCRRPVLLAPAMEAAMWEHPATVANLAILVGRGAVVVGPVDGRHAGGAGGAGRMAEPEEIAAGTAAALGTPGWLAGQQVVVTAGGTREPIDRVRYLGNRSGGRMGHAIAAEALSLGARVTLITAAAPPSGPARLTVVPVDTAADMHAAVVAALPGARLLVMAAAVADVRPSRPSTRKLPKGELPSQLALEPTVDILAALRDHPARAGVTIVGFAAETDEPVAHAAAKLRAKGLDLIVANDVGVDGIGMGAEDNAVTILDAGGVVAEVGRRSKRAVAAALLETVRGWPGRP